ncbi:hypothetical protein HIM_08334 [Hirsutella minnesotensis 3608]|uniref:Chorismate-utilising enzyme C-terminal domain-containing protein n=1 Tax=Hirsutella minnesotensis 3608 TaxID=1043627 RepID=A0A0F7ZT09_9HYPO|nr:hypothetical protein HIM_08334 [Hirsutella minnesotensis 3608]
MGQLCKPKIIPHLGEPLDTAVALLQHHRDEDYYGYELGDVWYIGIRSYASLVIGPDGTNATWTRQDGQRQAKIADSSLNDISRSFISEFSASGRIFGQVGFNYTAHTSGQAYIPGQWPLLSLMVPFIQVVISRESIILQSFDESQTMGPLNFLQNYRNGGPADLGPNRYPPVDILTNPDEYKVRVAKSILEIKKGKYTTAVPSRIVNLPQRVDMLATLLHGRQANTPARTFTFSHLGIQATGFSPEIVLSIENQVASTDALAGTRLWTEENCGSIANPLLNDPKEVFEHVIAVRGAIRRLTRLCSPDTISVKRFMSIMPRGNVQHIFSRVTGCLLPGKDGWDSIRSNITVPGVPSQRNMEAIQTFEPTPRDLYGGAVLMLDGTNLFEATLAIRTVFQDKSCQWLQAGAGITEHSNPEREFVETCEKLASVAPYLVAECTS